MLSPLGAALIGLKAGSQMPFFAAGHTHIVTVERVSRKEPNVIALLFCFARPSTETKSPSMTIQDHQPRK